MKAVLCAALVAFPLTAASAQSLPALDTLTATSSFAAFVGPDVPLEMHRQALRRLWALTPALSGPDLLDIHALEGATGAPVMSQVAAVATPPTSVQQTSVVPSPETLDRHSDFTVYLTHDTPVAVHQAAMRRLWSTHPEFARYSDDPMHSAAIAEPSADQPRTHAAVAPAVRVAAID